MTLHQMEQEKRFIAALNHAARVKPCNCTVEINQVDNERVLFIYRVENKVRLLLKQIPL